MEDYESQYEEYKQSLLLSPYFREKLREKYRSTLDAEKDYIDAKGVLDKIIVLSVICGFCYAMTFSLVQLDKFPGVLIRAVLAIIGTACVFWALYIGSEYKTSSGKATFHSFQYERYIENRVKSDKEAELKFLLHDLLSGQIDKEEFRQKYETLSRYDNYLIDLVNDYQFNEILTKNL